MSFAELTKDQVSTLWNRVNPELKPRTKNPEEFATLVLSGKMAVFDVIISCINCSGDEWDAIISKLMDKPLYKCAVGETAFPLTDYRGNTLSSPRGHRYGQTVPSSEEITQPSRKPSPRPRRTQADPRVIMTVKDNPKAPGSKAHARYALYRVGMTVDEFLKAGGRKPDINYDLKHGFITVGFVSK